MTEKMIRLFPDPVLRRKAEPVKQFGRALQPVIQKLNNAMRAHSHSIGIAAPQIGIPKRIAIVDVSSRVPDADRLILINPKILELRGERVNREGCMSIPEYTAYLKRYDWIRFRWQDEEGNWHERTATGIEAICVQHEVDHLDGVLFLDRVVCLRSDTIPRPTRKSKQSSKKA